MRTKAVDSSKEGAGARASPKVRRKLRREVEPEPRGEDEVASPSPGASTPVEGGAPTRMDRAPGQAEAEAEPRKPGRPRTLNRNGLSDMEIASGVCKYLALGKGPEDIADLMLKDLQVEMNRQEPYRIIKDLAYNGHLRFIPPREEVLRKKLKEGCGKFLKDVQVVNTAMFDHVVPSAVKMLLDLVIQRAEKKRRDLKRKERRESVTVKAEAERGDDDSEEGKKSSSVTEIAVHIAFTGGNSIRKVAMQFAELLREPREGLPDRIVFHTLVSTPESEELKNDPNAFLIYFVTDPPLPVKTNFVRLRAPGFVDNKKYQELLGSDEIQHALAQVTDVDIIVTSASCWADDHSMYRRHMEEHPSAAQALEEREIIGDMMWLPLSNAGPLENHPQRRAMSILELTDLSSRIQKGTDVFLILGPCGRCHSPKTKILKAILNLEEPLITHLIVDSRTAGGLYSE